MLAGQGVEYRAGRTVALTVALAVLNLCTPQTSPADQPPAAEYAVKAAYLVNFLLFVEPSGTGGATTATDRVIGIIGVDPFGDSFQEVENRPIGKDGRKLRIVRLTRFDRDSAAVLRRCDLLFVAGSEHGRAGEVIKALEGAPVLTVSEADGFGEAGGMIRLVLSGNRVRWEINRAALNASGLVASSQLYRNALRVTGGPAE